MRRPGSTAVAAVVAALLIGPGCAGLGSLGRRDDLEETQKKYVRLLRWGEYDAASSFVADDARPGFREQIPALQNIRFSDYEIIDTELNEDVDEAKILVSYRAYHLGRLVEHAWSERQTWERGAGGEWRITPDLDELRAALDTLEPRQR